MKNTCYQNSYRYQIVYNKRMDAYIFRWNTPEEVDLIYASTLEKLLEGQFDENDCEIVNNRIKKMMVNK